ncbi:hypothetical protein AAVH_09135 [Aphelenchoides avenae]|nr:hypothetical protein AAVH_09135 [Aphelenchus avenae]
MLAESSSRAFLLQAGVQPENNVGVHFVGLPLMVLTVVGVAVAPLYWGYMTRDNNRDWDCERFDRTILEVTRRYVCMLNDTTTLAGSQAAIDWMGNCTSKLKQVTSPLASAEAWAEVEEACRYSPIDTAELSSTFNDSEHCTVHRSSADSAPWRLVSVNVERVLVMVLVVVSYAALLWQLGCFVHHWNKFIKSHLADAYCLSDLSPDAMVGLSVKL